MCHDDDSNDYDDEENEEEQEEDDEEHDADVDQHSGALVGELGPLYCPQTPMVLKIWNITKFVTS